MSIAAAYQAPMSESEFWSQYDPSTGWLEFAEAQAYPVQRVWTIVENDGVLSALAGFRRVNRIGSYIVTEKPWVTGEEEVLLHCGCDVDGRCDMCMPPPLH